MSLLLEALKKAELAKQMAKAESASPGSPQEPAKQVMTREKLPDISQPLEILTDDLPSSGHKPSPPRGSRPELSLEPATPSAAAEPQVIPTSSAPTDNRAQARQLFQVREMDYNPRRPFYLTLMALALVGAGYGGYLWWQLRPRPNLGLRSPVEAAAAPAANPAPVVSRPPVETAVPQQALAGNVAQSGAQGTAARPAEAIPPIRPAKPIASAAHKSASRRAMQSGSLSMPRAESPQREPPIESPAPISVKPSRLAMDPMIERAYEAFQKNDLVTARENYEQVLTREPNNRDALLGLAAIDVRTGNFEAADARYLRLLELDPRDPYAVAGLTAFRGQLDPVRSESRLKTLIATQPEAPQLYFALGNEYAKEGRWSDAQSVYFKAYSADPENADYAFNLAVSLDQLRQRKPALEYYARALALSKTRPASFNRDQAQARVEELSK